MKRKVSQEGRDKKRHLLQVDSACDPGANTDFLMDDNEEYDTNLEDRKKKMKEIEFF